MYRLLHRHSNELGTFKRLLEHSIEELRKYKRYSNVTMGHSDEFKIVRWKDEEKRKPFECYSGLIWMKFSIFAWLIRMEGFNLLENGFWIVLTPFQILGITLSSKIRLR